MVTLATIQASLDAIGEAYHILHLQDGARLCVTRLGGRILGIFPDADHDNLMWVNQAVITNAENLRQFTNAGGWNLGGERVWIAPEIQYNIRDRRDFWGTHHVPPQMDPGNYMLERQSATHCRLAQDIELSAYNLAQDVKHLHIERNIIGNIPDPLRHLPDYHQMVADVQYFGYAHAVTLTEKNDTSVISESWNLVQLNPGGQLTIPAVPTIEPTTYFGDPADDAKHIAIDAYRIHITGQRQYKVGYKSICVSNRIAYLNRLSDNKSYLLVRHFDNNPSAHYTEEPPNNVGNNGHSIHVYNDGGEFGGNGEMECNGQGMGGITGRKQSTDTFTMWCYLGREDTLKHIGAILLGVIL